MQNRTSPDYVNRLETRLARLEAVQVTVLMLDRMARRALGLDGYLATTHNTLQTLIASRNFYVALYDAADDSVRFVYFVDEMDPKEDPRVRYPVGDEHSSATAWVIRHKTALAMTKEEYLKRRWRNSSWKTGTAAEHWLGAPLLAYDGRCLGAMVIQTYTPGEGYSDEDVALFGMIAHHVASAIERQRVSEGLTLTLADRTAQLEREIAERHHAEALQRGLFEIAALASGDVSTTELYAALHKVIGSLLDARNFFILLWHPDSEEISFPYFVDSHDTAAPPPSLRLPFRKGISSFVLRSREPQLIDAERFKTLVEQGDIHDALGNLDFVSWMGAPLIAGERVYGIIALQSYDAGVVYSEKDLTLLAYVAANVATTLARLEARDQLKEAALRLEQHNHELATTVQQLRDTQDELVRQEKLASLGGLVAGIAHEINTPLGICVTATSHLQTELQTTWATLRDGSFSAEQLDDAFTEMDGALRILENNTRRAAQLVRSFKQVAVDQSSGERRRFELAAYLDEILLSLKPRLKLAPCRVSVECPANLQMDSFPGALSQVMTNLILNAIVHGFEGRSEGLLSITATVQDARVQLVIADDGIGMSAEHLKQIFDPFFTTKRGRGGSGLGAHIVYSLTTNVLGGQVQIESRLGAGTTVRLLIPMVAPG